MTTHEDFWPFWLDDACYRVGKGQAYLAIAGEVSDDFWETKINPEKNKYEIYHGVLIRFDRGEIQIVKHAWVYDLLDTIVDGWKSDAIRGALLGYSSTDINEFIQRDNK